MILLLFLLTLVFFWYFISGRSSFQCDGCYLWYPNMNFVMNQWRKFKFPSWNPYDLCGKSCLADNFCALFYPFYWPLVFFVKNGRLSIKVLECVSMFHVFFAGVFTYYFCLEIGLSLFASLVAALAYMFGGRLVAGMDSPVEVALYWFPFILLFMAKAIAQNNIMFALVAGMGFGMAGLAFHGEHHSYLFYTILFFSIWHKAFLYGAVVLGVGLGVGAIQIIPTMRLLKKSARKNLPLSDSTHRFLNPTQLLGFLFPYRVAKDPSIASQTFPGFEESHLYMGIIPFLAGIGGILYGQGSEKVFFSVLCVIVIFYMLGKRHFVYPLLYHLMVLFYPFRTPIRTSWLATFSLAVLGGMFLDKFSFPMWAKVVLSGLVFVDLYHINSRIHSYKIVHPQGNFPPLARIDFIKQDKGDFRVYADKDDILKNNWGSMYEVKNICGYAPLIDKEISGVLNWKEAKKIFQKLNVKYVISKEPVIAEAFPVFRDGDYNVFLLDYFGKERE